jgi:hypothetical protein
MEATQTMDGAVPKLNFWNKLTFQKFTQDNRMMENCLTNRKNKASILMSYVPGSGFMQCFKGACRFPTHGSANQPAHGFPGKP